MAQVIIFILCYFILISNVAGSRAGGAGRRAAVHRGSQAIIFYGHQTYDFSESLLTFLAPGQVAGTGPDVDISEMSGWVLLFHPDLVAKFALGQKIARYSFFSYEVHEALHLSAKEERLLKNVLHNMHYEYEQAIGAFSNELLVAQLEVLLGYANRFYHRQLLTRRVAKHDLLSRFETHVTATCCTEGNWPLPSVQQVAEALHVSPDYLSNTLRALTGRTAQQHLHQALIEKAKRLLLSTSLTISETPFQLGFEYPHYLTRLFKRKTSLSPASFRFSAQ